MSPIAIGIHGGCGTLDQSLMSAAEWAEARQHLADALKAGWALLRKGASSIDAVEAAVVVMENSWHFNAGFGAALNTAGEHELDASIMDGATLGGGAVCAVRRIRNPVRAARAVMEKSANVLIAGAAAACECGSWRAVRAPWCRYSSIATALVSGSTPRSSRAADRR